MRVLIIDDCSPDDSFAVAQAARGGGSARRGAPARGQPRPHRHLQRRACSSGRTATTRVLISADDVMAPGALARAVAVMERDPEVGFVYGHAVSWDDSTPTPPRAHDADRHAVWPGTRVAADRLRPRPLGDHLAEVVVRTAVQQQIGGYRSELPHTGGRRDVDALRGPRQSGLHQGRRPGLLPDPRHPDDHRARPSRRPAAAQARVRRCSSSTTATVCRSAVGYTAGPSASSPRRRCGARAARTSAGG